MRVGVAVVVSADNLARIIDTVRFGAEYAVGIVQRREGICDIVSHVASPRFMIAGAEIDCDQSTGR